MVNTSGKDIVRFIDLLKQVSCIKYKTLTELLYAYLFSQKWNFMSTYTQIPIYSMCIELFDARNFISLLMHAYILPTPRQFQLN